jgi:hypothetical protein
MSEDKKIIKYKTLIVHRRAFPEEIKKTWADEIQEVEGGINAITHKPGYEPKIHFISKSAIIEIVYNLPVYEKSQDDNNEI